MNIEGLATPAVVIREKALKRNIAAMSELSRSRGVSLRPHVKTHNLPAIALMQAERGIAGITVATLREALRMEKHGFRDIFIAREIADPAELAILAGLSRRVSISLAVDSPEGVRMLSRSLKSMKGRGRSVDALIEIDTGSGRCGLRPGPEVAALARTITGSPGLSFKGIFTHEGNVYAAGSLAAMRESSGIAVRKMAGTAALLRDRGFPVRTVSIGSSPSAKLSGDLSGITEIRPGNYVFNDAMQVLNRTAAVDDCALRVIATVISKPSGSRTVLNVGTKLLGSDRSAGTGGEQTFGLVVRPGRYGIVKLYEEHAVVTARNALKIGDRVEIIPHHACIVANLAPRVFLAGPTGTVLEEWAREG
jgi:D-serine deaminase-like pyridoxal phosphate-dependent protein